MLARLGLRPGWPDILVMRPAPTTVEDAGTSSSSASS
jgi:hypothetical protein